MFFYPIYNWMHSSLFPSHNGYVVVLLATIVLLVAMPFAWRRWWAFTALAVLLIAMNLLAYSGAIAQRADAATSQNWLNVLLVSIFGLALASVFLQWRHGDPARRHT